MLAALDGRRLGPDEHPLTVILQIMVCSATVVHARQKGAMLGMRTCHKCLCGNGVGMRLAMALPTTVC